MSLYNFYRSDEWENLLKVIKLERLQDGELFCEYCGKPLSRSEVNDFGSLCERCYMKEYYGKDEID